ncbi:MAG: HD domain-containing protein [Candidatus Cloacimonadia bacterium]
MERIAVNRLKNFLGQDVESSYLIMEKEYREGAKGFYLRLRLGDKTGSLNAYIWDNAEYFTNKCQIDDFVVIKGRVRDYKGQLQLTVLDLKVVYEGDGIEVDQFIQTTAMDINQLSESLFEYIDSVKDEFIKTLLKSIFEDHEFFLQYAKAPAAKNWHHNYRGGLLEHTIAVARLCDFSAQFYPVDRDLLLAGALLHDIGKVQEYHGKKSFDFTNIGRLIGHVVLGDELVAKKAAEIDAFPTETLMKLRHMIISHHGELEMGAARVPQTLEATLLRHADNLDAQTTGVKQIMEQGVEDISDWSEYDKLNNRYYYLK